MLLQQSNTSHLFVAFRPEFPSHNTRRRTSHHDASTSPPPVLIPTSESIVEVSIVKTTSYMKGFPASTFVEPDVAGFEFMDVGS